MEVILLQDDKRLGKRGDVVKVANGYARNYLFPKELALPNTANNLKVFKEREKIYVIKESKAKRQAAHLAEKLLGISCTAAVQAGEEDKLFGSVTSADIANLLKEQGIDIDKRKIMMDEPLKALGIYNIPVKLHPEVEGKIKVWVVRA